jgi:hypothetical protein
MALQILSFLINIPKFLETKVIERQEQVEEEAAGNTLAELGDDFVLNDPMNVSTTSQTMFSNVTVYSIDVTELRLVQYHVSERTNFKVHHNKT